MSNNKKHGTRNECKSSLLTWGKKANKNIPQTAKAYVLNFAFRV